MSKKYLRQQRQFSPIEVKRMSDEKRWRDFAKTR